MTSTVLIQIPAEIICGVLRDRNDLNGDSIICMAGDFNDWDIDTQEFILDLDQKMMIYNVIVPRMKDRVNFMFKLFTPEYGWFVVPFFEIVRDTVGNRNNILFYNSLNIIEDKVIPPEVYKGISLTLTPEYDDLVNEYVEVASVHELSSAEELLDDNQEFMKSVSFTMNDIGTEAYSYLERTPQDTSMGSMSHSTRSFGKSTTANSLHALAFKVRDYFR